MDEFDGGGERDRAVAAVAAVAAQPRGGHGQHRAQTLAAGRDDVAGELRDQRHRAVHARHDQRVDAIEIGAQEPEQRVEGRLRRFEVAIDTRHRRHQGLLRLISAVTSDRGRSRMA